MLDLEFEPNVGVNINPSIWSSVASSENVRDF